MAETRFDPAQEQISNQSTEIVQYLRAIAKHHKHIGEVFECANGRLFFNMENIDFPTRTDALLSSEELDDYFWRKIEIVGTTINELSYRFIKKTFVEYFFQPIEESAAWSTFWAEQAPRIRETHIGHTLTESSTGASRQPHITISSETPEERANRIKYMVAGAFAYKIQCAVTKNNPEKQKRLIKMLDVYTKVVNSIHDPKKVMRDEPDTAKASFMGELDLLAANIADKTIPFSDITNRTRKAIESIRENNKHYRMAQDNQKILYECLVALLKKPVVRDEAQKKIAGAILLDLNEHYGKKMAIAPAFLFGVVQVVLPYCSADKKESCSAVIAWYDTMEKNQLSFRQSFELTRDTTPVSRRAITPTPSRRVLVPATEKPLTRGRSKSLLGDKRTLLSAPFTTFTPRGDKSSEEPACTKLSEANKPN
jgi:hypothetical protein